MWIQKFEKKGLCSVRAVVEYEAVVGSGIGSAIRDLCLVTRQVVIESQIDLDSLPENCYAITLMFEDGSYKVGLPISGFKRMFEIIPEGGLTDGIFGN